MLLAILSSLAVSCTTPPDVPVCVPIHPEKAWCTYTISDREFYITDTELFEGKSWAEIDHYSLRVPASSWAQIKAYILKQCKKNKDCSDNLGKWERKGEKLDQKLPEK